MGEPLGAQDVLMDPTQMAPTQSSHLYSFLTHLVMSVLNVHGTQLLKKSTNEKECRLKLRYSRLE